MDETCLASLWERLSRDFRLGPKSVHGPDHWRRVEANGLRLVGATAGADLLVVRLFAVFHDAERWDDGSDLGHGPRAATLVRRVHRDWFEVSDSQLEVLAIACRDHTAGDTAADPTIGCCWDADRLDLPRVGIMPHPDFMSTPLGRSLAGRCA